MALCGDLHPTFCHQSGNMNGAVQILKRPYINKEQSSMSLLLA